MTKDIKNKLTTFLILLFACVLLLVVSLMSDYRMPPSKQMDNDAAKIDSMNLLNSKQKEILSRMDTIESKLKAFEPTANDAVVLSHEIEQGIADLSDYFMKNGFTQSAFKGVTENYKLLLVDKQNIKTTVDNTTTINKKADDCKTLLKSNKDEIKQINLILGITNKNASDK